MKGLSENQYVLSIDQGTTSSRAMLFSASNLKLIQTASQEYPQIYPQSGYVEHNLNDIWQSVQSTIEQCLKKSNVNPKHIIAIGITNQRETTCAFDNDSHPLANAIVWQDRRTDSWCQTHKATYQKKNLQQKTGLPLDPYFSASKMRWLIDHEPAVRDALNNKNLKFGTIDTFLTYKLTGGKSHITDPSNASRTLLFNLQPSASLDWDQELLDFFDIPKWTLPRIANSFANAGDIGLTHGLSFLPDGIPITCILGDQQAALFGQGCTNAGDLKCTYGTGAFALVNTGAQLQYSNAGMLSTVAYSHNNQLTYALEGSCYIAGAAVQWLRDNLGLLVNSAQVEDLARKCHLNEIKELTFLPFFSGLGSPHWQPQVKGAIVGIHRGVGREQLSLACLEGIVFSIGDLIQSMEKDLPVAIKNLRVDGGATANDLLMELQASQLNKEIIRPSFVESTVFGAALGALVGLGLIDLKSAQQYTFIEKTFTPNSKMQTHFAAKQTVWNKWVDLLIQGS